MRSVISLIIFLFLLFFPVVILAFNNSEEPITIESTNSAKINLYFYKRASSSSKKQKPVLLIHGFNSSGSVWRNKKINYAKRLTQGGYDVIVVDMRGNKVDTDGDHKVDAPRVGDSWGYGIRDLGDDVATALIYGIDYLNKNLPGRNYKKADVITHSTGALAVTSYSRSLGLIPYRDNIDTIIELAPPNNGSTTLMANIKDAARFIPSVFTQSMVAYEYALEFLDDQIWIPGGRMESENLRKQLIPESMFLKTIKGLGPEPRIKTFIGIGDEDGIVGDWSPVIQARDDIGYEYFVGLGHSDFCNSELVITALLDKLKNGMESKFFRRYKPYRNKRLVAFLSGPGIDHPDDTFDVVSFARNVDITPRDLFDLYLRIAGRKNKKYLLKYWEGIVLFEEAQEDLQNGGPEEEEFIDRWQSILGEKNNFFHDNFIYASQQYLECPDIAVLANGYYNELMKLIIEQVKEPVRIIDHTFNPSILAEQKLLIIPSGGLSGLSTSHIFKRKISEFVKNGGTLICFSQQHGYDFNALPGDSLKGYGWQEDVSCYRKAAYIENFHQIFSSQTELYPDLKLDGYFTQYPEGSKILLRRSKNLMPAMLMYNYGDGLVIATTTYSDWGYINGQASQSELNLVRDLIRWAKVSVALPEYKIGKIFRYTLSIKEEFSNIEMLLKSPQGKVLKRYKSSRAEYVSDYVLPSPGIYSVDYILYNSNAEIIQPQTEGFYFSFSQPPEGSAGHPDFSFNITSDGEDYIDGAAATFTFHLKNNTAHDETIKCKAALSHHQIKFTESIKVPAASTVSFDKEITLKMSDRLTADFYSSGNSFLGHAERGINVFEPKVAISIDTERQQYIPGQDVMINSSVLNDSETKIDLFLALSITDSDNNEVYYKTKSVTLLDKGDSFSQQDKFQIPRDASRGLYRIKLSAFSNSRLAGSSSVTIDIPAPLIYVESETELPQDFFRLMTVEMKKLLYAPGEQILADVIVDARDSQINSALLNINVLLDIQTGYLSGTIEDIGGNPIEGARVNNIYTNKEGRYRLNRLSTGRYTLDIVAPGYERVKKDIDILAGENNLNIVLNPAKYGTISGMAEELTGSDLTLKPININGSDSCVRYTSVTSSGSFGFKHLPAGTYVLDVQPEGIAREVQVNEGKNIVSLGGGHRDTTPPASGPEQAAGQKKDLQEIEPNNSLDTANGIDSVVKIRGSIGEYGDEDFFKFVIDTPAILDIFLKDVADGFRPYIKIYNPLKRWFDSTAAFSGENIEHSLEISEPGTYYLQLKDRYNNFSSPQEYLLELDIKSGQDEYEPNADFKTAKLIDLKRTVSCTIFPKSDRDYFAVDIDKKGTFYIDMLTVPDGFRPSIKLYDSSGKLVSQKGGSSGEAIDLEAEIHNPGRHYIMIKDWYSGFSSLDTYTFRTYFINTLDRYEPDDTRDDATSVRFDDCYFATIAPEGDIDFYKLSIPDEGRVMVFLDDVPQNIRPYIKLYRESRNYWIDSTAGLAGDNLKIEFKTNAPSNYFLQIQDRYNSESSPSRYRLFAIYIPSDSYPVKGPAIFTQEMEISDITGKKKFGIKIPAITRTGKYYLQVVLESLDSTHPQKVAQAVERFYIGDTIPIPASSPDIKVSYLEDTTLAFDAGKKARFSFSGVNTGAAGGVCQIDFRFRDIYSRTLSCFLEPGMRKDFQFEFMLPVDLEEGTYTATYTFEGETKSITFTVSGVKIDVEAKFEGNIFKILVKNQGSARDTNLSAEVRCGGYEGKKDFILLDSEELSFDMPDIEGQEKIYYGIYFTSGKALYLDAFLLDKEEAPENVSVRIINAGSDKYNYGRNEKVLLKWDVESAENYAAQLEVDLITPDGESIEVIDEAVRLDKGMNVIDRQIAPDFHSAGLYRAMYRFIYNGSVAARGSIFFEIGEEVRVTMRLDKEEYIEGEDIKFNIAVFSSAALDGKLTIYLDGKKIKDVREITVDGYENFDFDITVGHIGRHNIRCDLFYNGTTITSGKTFFDILPRPEPNHPPVLFSIGKKNITAGELIEFSINAMDLDADTLFYSAEGLPDGAIFDSDAKKFSWRPGAAQIGEHFVIFKVSDGKDNTMERVKIVVSENVALPPVPSALATPLTGLAPLEVHFSPGNLSNTGAGSQIVKYEWDFDGKGVYDIGLSGSGETVFIYTGEGQFPVRLRIIDKDANTSLRRVTIDVGRNPAAPEVFLEAVPLEGLAPCKVYFKGKAVSAADICKYDWDFDGDGVYDASSEETGEVVKTYGTPGEYKAELKVTDSEGLSDTKSVTVKILDPRVLKVEPVISVGESLVPVEVEFDAIVESENNIQKFQWDFEGDGKIDFTSADSARTTHTYFEAGVYTPTLIVTDDMNISSETNREIRLGSPIPGDIISLPMGVKSRRGKAPFKVHFSLPANFGISEAKFYWDFDGDRLYDLVTYSPEAEHTYYTPGVYVALVNIETEDRFIRKYREVIYVIHEGGNKGKEIGTPGRAKRVNVLKDRKYRIELSDKTFIELPAGLLPYDDVLNVRKLQGDEVFKEIMLDGRKDIIPAGEYREYRFENHITSFDKEVTISIPYMDRDNDGIIDGKNIDELSLDAFWFDESNGKWRLTSDALIFPQENLVTVRTNHFSIFGIAGIEKESPDVPVPEETQPAGDGGDDGEGNINCFIATAVFGTPMAKEVRILCEYRDRYLLKCALGRSFVTLYYRFSPTVADFIKDKPLLKSLVRFHLKFLVNLLHLVL